MVTAETASEAAETDNKVDFLAKFFGKTGLLFNNFKNTIV